MKTFLYNAQDEPNPIEMTEEQILSEYWAWWSMSMANKFGSNSDLITKQNCIEDWVVVHWAWEKK